MELHDIMALLSAFGGYMASYGKAAIRHLKDAELLAENGRLNNAAQLLGFSAECVIKRVLELNGYQSGDGGLVDKDPVSGLKARKHVNVLAEMQNELRLFISGRNGQRCLPRFYIILPLFVIGVLMTGMAMRFQSLCCRRSMHGKLRPTV